jgi:type II secretory pathway pseudopilin PulG
MKKNAGFSIVELLVITGIIGVLVLMMGAGLQETSRIELKDDARELVSQIYKLRAIASKENRSVQLNLSSVPFSYSYLDDGSGITGIKTTLAKKVSMKSGPDFAINSRGFVFDSSNPNVNISQQIVLQSEDNEWIRITIFPYGGIKTASSWRNES